MIDHRRDRARRLAVKRPASVAVDVEYAPFDAHGVRDRLVALLAEMLDARRDSGRG